VTHTPYVQAEPANRPAPTGGDTTTVAAPPLDREVQRLKGDDPHGRWGLTAFAAILGTVLVEAGVGILAAQGTLGHRGGLTAAIAGLVGEGLVAVPGVLAIRSIVRHNGGWRATLGFDLPSRGDGKTIATWWGLQLAARMSVAYLVLICIPAARGQHISNLTGLRNISIASAAVLVIAAVLVAPVVEELLMRGIVLRAAMRAMPFWPAAVLNALIFGALHAHEGDTALAAAILAVSTGTFGLVQCLLVRRTARLGPAIGVHATTNLVAVTLALIAANQ
jgi:membrane protease YdiL (CAAX protease family)